MFLRGKIYSINSFHFKHFQVYNSVVIKYIHIVVWPSSLLSPELPSSQTETTQLTPIPSPSSPWSPLFYFFFQELKYFCPSYKRAHAVFVLLYLACFTSHVFKAHPCCSMNQVFHSFLRPNNTPLYVYPTFCLFICRWMFGCSHLLAIVGNATPNGSHAQTCLSPCFQLFSV